MANSPAENAQMVYNGMETPDGTLLESFHRHMYVTHEDKNGKHYELDGGLSYIKCSVNKDEKFITVYDDEPFERVREYFHWGRNYDKDMKLLPKTEWIKLKDITNDHLEALLRYPTVGWVKSLFIKESEFRKLKV